MKKTAVLLSILLTTSLLSPVLGATTIDPSKIHFYMYGMATCPHCHRMREEIPKVYGNDSLTYYELVDNKENQQLFNALYKYTAITGVPAIAITYNGTLYAVLEGEFNVSAVPQIIQSAMKSNGVLLFNGKWYIFPRNDTKAQEAIKALYTIFVEHKMPAETSTSTTTTTSTTSTTHTQTTTSTTSSTSTPYTPPVTSTSGGSSGICGPAFIVLLAAIPAILFKKMH
ncbi:thioredoxin fold domain-containing protein [Thermococcus sp.]